MRIWNKFKRWSWTLAAGPFFGAFMVHPCLDHGLLLLVGSMLTLLGFRKQHCCVKDCMTKEITVDKVTVNVQKWN